MNEERKAYEEWLHKVKETIIDGWDAWQARAALSAQPEPAAPTVVEPVAWIFMPNNELLWPAEVEATNPIEIDSYRPLYTHPPRTALSDEQINNCLPLGMAPHSTLVGPDEIRRFARAIEAAHGIGKAVTP
jgi:hypothetical protein